MDRRKLLKLIAGVVAAPRELLAAPVSVITPPAYQFGFTDWKDMRELPIYDYPMIPEECFWASGSITISSPRMMFELKGITVPEDDEVTT